MTESAPARVLEKETISPRLERAISELKSLHEILLSGEGLDPRILTDFRDAVNRVRNTAWSAQQFLALKETGEDGTDALSIAAAERVRAAYQLCQAIQEDLQRSDVKFQPGHVIELHHAVQTLHDQLTKTVSGLSG
jgi:hypothetical protein